MVKTTGRALSAVVLLGLLLAGCEAGGRSREPAGTTAPTTADPAPPALADGLYLVRRRGPTEGAVAPLGAGEAAVPYTRRFAPPGAGAAPEVLVVRREPGALLKLAGPPTGEVDQACSQPLQLELLPDAAADLARLTAANVGATVAVVVGGEVVTAHKIRQPIIGGRLQVTCCSEGACGFLLQHLRR